MLRRIALFLAAFLILCGAPILLPGIDLWTSALFYTQGAGFTLGDWWLFRAVRAAMPYLVWAMALIPIALGIVAWWRRRSCCGVDGKAAIFLLLALAIGPGLVVNVLFKDHWGRARPAQTTLFGGDKRFSPAFVPSDQCATNCSFPAGDPAVGFAFFAAALLVPAPRPRRLAQGGALGLGAALGIVRLAQGGHFLSDVIASGFLVVATSWALHLWILRNDGLAQLLRWARDPPLGLRRSILLAIATAAAVVVSYAWLDRPIADMFRATPPALHALFRIITSFGVSTGWLILAALTAIACALASRRVAAPGQRLRLALAAWRAGFVFATVGGAGLVGDILKPVFGRARPELYLRDGIFGFTWHGAHAAYWSFPSGHAITIVALALSLGVVERRGRWLYGAGALLVVASRLVLDEHYLSDVFGGAFLAITWCWAMRAAFERAGIPLACQRSLPDA